MTKFARIIQSLILTLLVFSVQITYALAEKRVALIIGNSAYSHAAKLANPRNDASDISAVLKRLNFEVITGLDLNKEAMNATIRKFSKALDKAEVALFFYAGHGLQVNGKNYLAPTNANLSTMADLDFDTVPLGLILRQMERKRRTNIVFLDACRDNPLMTNLARSMGSTRSVNLTRGLARVETGVGTLISYSTQPGNVALDGTGRNSPFTTALLKHIETPGADISDIMISVRKDVLALSDGKQVPWENSSLTGQFYFNPIKTSQITTTKPQVRTATQNITVNTVDDKVLDLAFWNAIQASQDPNDMKAYLEKFPQGVFAAIAKRKIEASATPKVKDKPEPEKLTKLDTAVKPTPIPQVIKQEPPIAPPLLDKTSLVISLQTHLKRVGCYAGNADGDWGNQSRTALRKFNGATKRSLPVGQATQKAIDAVKSHKGRICAKAVVVRERTRKQPRRRHENRPTPRRQKRCRVEFAKNETHVEAPWNRVCD
jgi:hypothetical protein